MQRINLKAELTDEEASQFAATFLDDSSYDLLIDEDADVYRPDGEILLKYRRNALSKENCSIAFQTLKKLNLGSESNAGNRGMASGKVTFAKIPRIHRRKGVVFNKDGTRYKVKKLDGTLTNTNYAVPTPSGIIGFFDRYPRIPYCRQTAYNINHPTDWTKLQPFFREVNDAFQKEMPDRYKAQLEVVKKTSPDFVVSGTAFTTITVNKNWQTAVHKDAGDLPEGFGVLCALRSGNFRGGYLVFPKYKVAVDLRTQGLLLADVHQWHGNTRIVGKRGRFTRVSCVFYFRKKMIECGTAQQELEIARSRMAKDED